MSTAHALMGFLLVTGSAFAQDTTMSLKVSDKLNFQIPDTPAVAAEDSPVGYVKTATGSTFVVTDGKAKPANVGTPVMNGSVLKTGAGSTLGVTFRDGTMMSFGPETELKVDDYLYAPADGKLKFASRLVRGTMNYISGVIAKLKPDAVTVNTPTGMIGVRGTQFAAKVTPETP